VKRFIKIGLQVFLGLILGLAGGASIGGLRHYNEVVAWEADGFLVLRGDYAYLQYKHADSQHGESALLDYLNAVQWLQGKRNPILRKQLAFDSGLTYLRLFRLKQASNDTENAEKFMKLAQSEFSSIGWKDVSETALQRRIEAREANEVSLDANDDPLAAVPAGDEPANEKAHTP
jgi:hypothetical protein